jgi:PAS domain S-box-containing protein
MKKKNTPPEKNTSEFPAFRERIAALEASLAESKKAIDALKEGEERFRILFESAPECYYINNLKGVFLDGNKAAEKLVGYRKEELIGKSFLKLGLLSPADILRAAKLLMKNMLGQGTGPDIFTVNRKDGTQVRIELSSLPVKLRGKTVVLGIAHDVTERVRVQEEQQQLQARLIQAHKMEAVGQLAGGIAHDFNNILTAINCYGDSALAVAAEGDPVRPYLNHILSLADKAAHLTHSLLAFSRKQTIMPKPCGVNGIIENVRTLLSRILGEDIELNIVAAREDLTVMADSTQVERVLINLAANARDAMPGGGSLTIGTGTAAIDDEFIKRNNFGKAGAYALVSVHDTGSGMDGRTRERIFEPFFTTKEVGKGTGLGLSIVYGIVKQHNGFVTVDSEVGKGTLARIYLPVVEAAAAPLRLEAPAAAGEGRETILLAEDDEGIRSLTRTLLERNGYTVIEACDGQDAIDCFLRDKHRISLIISDVIMPRRNGAEVFEEARKHRPDIKSLFISGYPADTLRSRGILNENINFVPKPFMPKDLVRKVREVLDA